MMSKGGSPLRGFWTAMSAERSAPTPIETQYTIHATRFQPRCPHVELGRGDVIVGRELAAELDHRLAAGPGTYSAKLSF